MATDEGISIRLIRAYDPKDAKCIHTMDLVLVSCSRLGHTFRLNGPSEEYCGVCGLNNPDFVAGLGYGETPE